MWIHYKPRLSWGNLVSFFDGAIVFIGWRNYCGHGETNFQNSLPKFCLKIVCMYELQEWICISCWHMNLFHMCKWYYFTWHFHRLSGLMWIRKKINGCRVDSPKKLRGWQPPLLARGLSPLTLSFHLQHHGCIQHWRRSHYETVECNLSLFIGNFLDADTVDSSLSE